MNTRRERDDIVDNAFSRLGLAEPLTADPRDTLFIQVFNDGNEIVSVYVKRPRADRHGRRRHCRRLHRRPLESDFAPAGSSHGDAGGHAKAPDVLPRGVQGLRV